MKVKWKKKGKRFITVVSRKLWDLLENLAEAMVKNRTAYIKESNIVFPKHLAGLELFSQGMEYIRTYNIVYNE